MATDTLFETTLELAVISADLTERVDKDTYYFGYQIGGAATSDAKWRIMKMTRTYDGSKQLWKRSYPDGDNTHYKWVWDNRAGYTYKFKI